MPTDQPRAPRFALVAGEASGDQLGAGLIRAIRERHADARFAGIGGPRMAAQGMDCWHEADELALMGLAEVLSHLPRLVRLRRRLVDRIAAWRPDCFVGIDAPDFNLGLERRLKARGLHTVHYVSPSLWAWRQSRAGRIGQWTDRILTLFPFEPAIYARYGAEATYVGHPMADSLPLVPDRAGARERLGLPHDPDRPVIALLPGSRRGEVTRLAPIIAESVRRLATARPEAVFVCPAARRSTGELFAHALESAALDVPVRIYEGQAETVLTAADVAVIASGTATLEALLTRTPMVVIYRLAASTYFVVRKLGMLKVDRYSLPNVLAGGGELVPELMQYDLTPDRLADHVLRLLDDAAGRARLLAEFDRIHRQLRCDADQRAAEAVLDVAGLQR